MRKSVALFILFFVAVIWGGTFPIIKTSLQYISPNGFLTLRFTLGFLTLLPFFYRRLRYNRKALVAGFILSLFLFLGYMLQTLGLEYTTSSHSGFITGLYVVFTPLFAYFMLREKISLRGIIAVLLAVLGLFLLSNISGGINYGDFLTFLCAIAYAIQVVLVTKYSRIYDPSVLTVFELGFVSLFSTGGWISEGFEIHASPFLIFGVIYTGVLATAVAILAQTHAQKIISPNHAAVVYTMEPVFAGIFSYIFLGEILGLRGIIGAFLIFIGMLLVSLDKSSP